MKPKKTKALSSKAMQLDSLHAAKRVLMSVEVKEFKVLHDFFVCAFEFDVKPSEGARKRMTTAFDKAKYLYEQ